MRFRVYGIIKNCKTDQPLAGVTVKLYLGQENIQQGKSVKNGFYELIANIDDSCIKNDQQLRVIFEKEGCQIQEKKVLALEEPINLDVALEIVVQPQKSFNWLPVFIGGGATLALLICGVIVWLIISRPKLPKIISFAVNSNFVEVGQSAVITWKTKNASLVEIEPDIGEVSFSGNIQVQPTQITEYTLIANNEKGEIKEILTLELKDTTPPSVIISSKPIPNKTSEGKVTFYASASDIGGMSKVVILINGKEVKECNGSSCEFAGGPYSPGIVSYEAHAYDKADNKASTGTKALEVVETILHQTLKGVARGIDKGVISSTDKSIWVYWDLFKKKDIIREDVQNCQYFKRYQKVKSEVTVKYQNSLKSLVKPNVSLENGKILKFEITHYDKNGFIACAYVERETIYKRPNCVTKNWNVMYDNWKPDKPTKCRFNWSVKGDFITGFSIDTKIASITRED